MKQKAQSLTEYALILSVVLAAIIGMEVYIKRAVQARVKDLTDVLITSQDGHLDNINPVTPLLDEALGQITHSESHLQETVSQDSGSITRTKGVPDGESFYFYTESMYQSREPEKELSQGAEPASTGTLVVSGSKIGEIYQPQPVDK